jgi:hypothetical protein
MRTLKGWSLVAASLLAVACNSSNKPEPNTGGTDKEPAGDNPAEPSAFPGESDAAQAPAPGDEGSSAGAEEPAAAPPQVPAPTSAAPSSRSGSAPAADRSSAEKKSSRAESSASAARRPLETEERPGLGTTWGETRESHVSNAPFERANGNPFAVSTVRYNDENGISAMMRGGSLVNFRNDSGDTSGGVLTVRLLDANGSSLPTFMNSGRTLVQGEHGQRYTIEIANRSSSRFEAVVAVDGLDVVDGQTASFSKRGYLIQPFGTVEIDGFRQSMDEVAAFRFGSVRGSYAGRKGNDRNVGVIGVAFFAERGARVWNERELVRREAADPFPGRFASPPIAR